MSSVDRFIMSVTLGIILATVFVIERRVCPLQHRGA